MLLEEIASASGPLFFYAMSNSANAFRFPLQRENDDRVDDVLRAKFDDANADRPSGMVPVLADPLTAWFSLSSQDRLVRVTFAR